MGKPTSRHQKTRILMNEIEAQLELHKSNPIDASAWFLGPRAENARALLKFVKMAARHQIESRRDYMPEDPPIFEDYEDGCHQRSIRIIKRELKALLKALRGSIPLASYRNQSHMYWDITLPGAAGYFAAMLYNQNNVAAEASPVTTLLEVKVGEQLCEMLGFGSARANPDADLPLPWGHITCDGSIANGESMWAARNLKFLPIALAAAIANEPDLEPAKCVTVSTCDGRWGRLIDLTPWELLNLPIDTAIGLVQLIEQQSGVAFDVIKRGVDRYSVQNQGLVQFQRRFLESYDQATPAVLVPATAHYSWPKSGALLGLGTDAVKSINVDLDGRMCMRHLRETLYDCLDNGLPVLQVVAVVGSTEEGAIDPLADIVEMRRQFQSQGLNFVVHVDGAWGGYFASMLRSTGLGADPAGLIDSYPELFLTPHIEKHYAALPEVDSVTLDPHKSGFIPYPAGGLCYRNGAMRDLISYTAPVVYHGGADTSVGVYGIEGSKPGAAAASVYLSHKVIPLNRHGYGRLLGRCLFNSKRFYAALVTMATETAEGSKGPVTQIHLTPFQRLPAEKQGGSETEIEAQKKYIRENIVQHQTDYLIEHVFGLPDPDADQQQALDLFRQLGSDLSIVTYAFNFSTAEGLNKDLQLMNELNEGIFNRLSLHSGKNDGIPSAEMFVTASGFEPAHYGSELVESFARRAGVEPQPGMQVRFLISTTQNPWLSTTSEGDVMLGRLVNVLRDTALDVANGLVKTTHPAKRQGRAKTETKSWSQ